MRTPFRAFNTFLLLALLLTLGQPAAAWGADGTVTNTAAGKKTKKKSSDRLAVIRFHIEATDDGSVPKAEVIRRQPQTFPIVKEQFFDERDVARADMLETPDGGFMIQITATVHGQQAMEMATVNSNGRHVVIYGQWTPDSDLTEGRWLAAPQLRGPLREGVMVFTADASRQEALMLVDGLNNVAVKLKNQPKSKSPSSQSTAGNQKLPSGKNTPAADLINSQQGK